MDKQIEIPYSKLTKDPDKLNDFLIWYSETQN